MQPIKKTSIVQQVVERLIEYIRNEKLTFDSKLPTEYVLCQQLNVSRSSLREAYRILQTQGYITIKPGRGTFVSSPLLSDDHSFPSQWFNKNKFRYLDLLEARTALEIQAVRFAARRITDEELGLLKENLDEFYSIMYEPNASVRLAELDEEFHDVIMKSTRNSFIQEINKLIADEIRIFRYTMMKIEDRRKNTYYPHLEVYNALCSHDPDQCADAMKQHLQLAENDMTELANQQKNE